MRVLVLGGTRFVGLAIVEELARAGHEVTRFHRGRSAVPGPHGVTELLGDRDDDLGGLRAGEWDATVDVSAYRPGQVESAAAALGGRGGHYVLVSSVSAYRDDIPVGSDESAPLADTSVLAGLELDSCPIDSATYGPLKVLCEQRAIDLHEHLLVMRPTYVIGPRDYTMRFPRWVEAISAGGVVRVPEPSTVPMQYVDARDLAELVRRCIDGRVTGAVHACSRSVSFADLLAGIAAGVAGPGLSWEPVLPGDPAQAADEFPLWGGPDPEPVLALDPSRAETLGLATRPLPQSARDTLEWLTVTRPAE